MKSAPRAESTPVKPKQKRRNRPRPTPRWLKGPVADGPEAIAQRRCLLVLSVLSGEQPVTDAIEATGVSRQLYYQLEEKALRAMLRALGPSMDEKGDVAESLAGQLAEALARVKQLETEKRRTERLLLLTRKLVRPGSLTMGRGGRPRKYTRSSTKAGRASSTPVPMKSETALAASSTPATTTEGPP